MNLTATYIYPCICTRIDLHNSWRYSAGLDYGTHLVLQLVSKKTNVTDGAYD